MVRAHKLSQSPLKQREPHCGVSCSAGTRPLNNLMHSLHLDRLIHSTHLHFPGDLPCSTTIPRIPKYGALCPHVRRTIAERGMGRRWSLSLLMCAGKCDAIHTKTDVFCSFVKAALITFMRLMVSHFYSILQRTYMCLHIIPDVLCICVLSAWQGLSIDTVCVDRRSNPWSCGCG